MVDQILQQKLIDIVGNTNVKTTREDLIMYGSDETEDLVFPPDIVLHPSSTEQVAAIATCCHQNRLPMVVIGARTGLSGGVLAVQGGVGISMDRMNHIVNIDVLNQQVIVQPGVITADLHNAVKEVGLYYPPDPSSSGSCFIGGNLAENAGGAHAVKYGTTKDYVLALEVVLPDGTVIHTGASTLKNATGYNLTQLIIGSEGTLGIITQATLRLIPDVPYNALMLVAFEDELIACDAVSAVFRGGVTPSVLEFLERDAIEWSRSYMDLSQIPVSPNVKAHLLLEVDGNSEAYVMSQVEQVANLLASFPVADILIAQSSAEKEILWTMRKSIGRFVKSNSIYREVDTVVPRYRLGELLSGVKQIGWQFGFKSVCYGHAGDGNLHVNIVRQGLSDEAWKICTTEGVSAIYRLAVNLGGTLSGEHGIGYVVKDFMPLAFNQQEIDLMRKIKSIFDPENIMNPGKIFP